MSCLCKNSNGLGEAFAIDFGAGLKSLIRVSLEICSREIGREFGEHLSWSPVFHLYHSLNCYDLT